MGRTPDWQPRWPPLTSLIASERTNREEEKAAMNYDLAYRIGFHPWEDLA